jgi:hypothetical protein
MGLRDDILRAKTIARPDLTAKTTEWMVDTLLGSRHQIMTKEDWIERHRSFRLNDPATASFPQRVMMIMMMIANKAQLM